MHYDFSGNFSSYSNTEFFPIGLLTLTPNGVAHQPLNVLSKCLIWNRETIYFKKKKVFFVATINYPVLTAPGNNT